MATFISFDVDGTLIKSVGQDANKLHKEAFSVAMKEVFGVDSHIDVIQHHGSTDPLVLIKVLELSGIPSEKTSENMPKLVEVMSTHYEQTEDRIAIGLQVLPGVPQLLRSLKGRGDVVTCLVTGNMERIGWGKMKALGIQEHFTSPNFGGFGSMYCSGNTEEVWRDRAELIKLAVARAEEITGGPIQKKFHVGDTPNDVHAAVAGGVKAVGVCTGIYGRRELQDCVPDAIILDDLTSTEKVMQDLGLPLAAAASQ